MSGEAWLQRQGAPKRRPSCARGQLERCGTADDEMSRRDSERHTKFAIWRKDNHMASHQGITLVTEPSAQACWTSFGLRCSGPVSNPRPFLGRIHHPSHHGVGDTGDRDPEAQRRNTGYLRLRSSRLAPHIIQRISPYLMQGVEFRRLTSHARTGKKLGAPTSTE